MKKEKQVSLEIHAYAALVPLATQTEQEVLTQDIKDNGLRDPITLWKGKVVDGRCRLAAWRTIGWEVANIPRKELDDELTEAEVIAYVKSVNTRRNLTLTQKVMIATKQTLDPANKLSVIDTAKSWGIGEKTIRNGKFIAKHKPEYIEPLFNGLAVSIKDRNGELIDTTAVSAICAAIKREQELDVTGVPTTTGMLDWNEDAVIKTQQGKDAYNDIKEFLGYTPGHSEAFAFMTLLNELHKPLEALGSREREMERQVESSKFRQKLADRKAAIIAARTPEEQAAAEANRKGN